MADENNDNNDGQEQQQQQQQQDQPQQHQQRPRRQRGGRGGGGENRGGGRGGGGENRGGGRENRGGGNQRRGGGRDNRFAEEEEKKGNEQEYQFANEIKVFNKWSTDSVQVEDLSLRDYIPIKGEHSVFLPHTAGRYQTKRFRKASCPIIERMVNSLMMHGRNNGKKLLAIRILRHSLEIIHLVTNVNPLQILVNALQNAGPREDSTRIGSAGVVRRQAVDVSPLRRVNQAIYLICTGARNNAFRNLKSVSECLADEIMNAANDNQNSFAIKKKDEIERVAKANR